MQIALIIHVKTLIVKEKEVIILIKIIKNGYVYAPEYLGKRDILIIGSKIGIITEDFNYDLPDILEVVIIDASGKYVFPGFIDSHVHITGGGGEGGFKTRTPEIALYDIIKGGITSIVGCLGTDGVTRTMESLYAKAKGLEEEGVSTYIVTGSYRIPISSLTGSPMRDIILIDKIIGAGEIALSDHRSSQPEINEIKRLAADIRVGGILSGKAGVVNVHLGDSETGLSLLQEIIRSTDIPYSQFLPTHINRSERLFEEGIKYALEGGYIDFTTSSDPAYWEDGEVKASIGLKRCMDAGVEADKITFTSDGQGSMPIFNENKEFIRLGIGSVTSLYTEVRDAILNDEVDIEKAIRVITRNPADIFKLKGKGRIKKGMDADLVLVDKDSFEIDTVIAKGKIMMEGKSIKVAGIFE